MEGRVDQYAVVGHPVAHSLSPFIHSLFARQTGQAVSYRLMDTPPEQFIERVSEFFATGGRGVNITLPHKTRAMTLANELTERARLAGAVNTLAARRDGTLLGDNTDGAGLVQDLTVNLGIRMRERSILLIGAGGAARGVIAPLIALAPRRIVITNRTAERAVALAAVFAGLGAVEGCGFAELAGQAFDVIINATSASLTGELPAVPATAFAAGTFCYDMAYGRGDTAFVRRARELGCRRAVPGWGMLVEQAAESFRLWRGVRPLTAPVLAALTGRNAELSAGGAD
ncbi:MAG: shikimate dehydrogenase [Steroidobacteraceae bacterium]